MYSGPLPCFPPGVCLSQWRLGMGSGTQTIATLLLPKEKTDCSQVCRAEGAEPASHPHPTPSPWLGGQPIKRLPMLPPSQLTLPLPHPPPRTKPMAIPTDRHLVAQSLETHELFSEAKRQDMGQVYCQSYSCHHQPPQVIVHHVNALMCQPGHGSHANL